MSDQVTDAPVADTTTDTSAQQQAQLQLSDILLAAQIIQLASSRGAFKVEEFTQIGGTYERLVNFLQASGAITPAAAPTETPAEPVQGN